MDSTTSSHHSIIFFSYPTEVGPSLLTIGREDSLRVMLSDLNGTDVTTEGSGSQESQVSAGGLERRLSEEAASFAAMEVESHHKSPPGTATRKSTSSSDSQVDSQSSQSISSQDVLMVDSPPRSLIRVWSPLAGIEHGLNTLLSPGEDKKPTDEGMLLLSHQGESTVASSSRATSCPSGIRHARNDDADDDSDYEEGPISRPDYTRRNEKRRRPIKTTVMDTRGRRRRGKGEHQCPVCRDFFADEKSLSRHRSAFKIRPACLDLDAAPLTVYLCRTDGCEYRDHRRDNVFNHEATHHPGEHIGNNVGTTTFDRAYLTTLIKNADQKNEP